MRKSTTSIILLITALLLSTANAKAVADWDFSGYFKTLLITGKTFFEEQYYLVLHRLRTQFTFHPTSSLEILAALDNQVQWGDYLRTSQYALVRQFEVSDYIDMTWENANKDVDWRFEPYRLYMHYYGSNVEFAVGRQRIAWGTGRIWNPTDLFNPTSPLNIEFAEKRGADSALLLLRPHDDWTIEFAAAIGKDSKDTRWAVRSGTTLGSYDINIMGGRFRENKVLGFDFSGYLGDSGFRGEFTYTWEENRSFTRGVLSFENTFKHGITLLAEYLYNGGNLGTLDFSSISDLATYDSIVTLNKHFLALQLSKQLYPLLNIQALSIIDLEEGSFFLSPFVGYSLLQNVDVLIGAQFFFGDSGEFALYHNAAFVSLEWYFD